MMRHSVPSLVLGLLALPGCPGPEPGNPTTLWLAKLGNDEKQVQLIDTEPPPF
jgi:hypothetical protein